MKDFVLYSSEEIPHLIEKEEFEDCTKNSFPFVQNIDGHKHYYATCPECENSIQLIGLYSGKRTYGAHTGKDIIGLNAFNYENYIYCPRSVQGQHVPKDVRKNVASQKDISVYNTLRNYFDLTIEFAKKYFGFYISSEKAKEMLDVYYASEGWLYPHSTVNNLPFMLCYLQPATNPRGILVRKDSTLERAISKCDDLQLITLDENKYKYGKYYKKLMPKKDKYLELTMMIWKHRFAEQQDGTLKESVNIQICKDISPDPERHEWKELLDQKIDIPELNFVKWISSDKVYRKPELQKYAESIMADLE